MKRALTRKKLIEQAAKHHTDLTMFGAIIGIAESGVFYTSYTQAPINRIIKICKDAMQRHLREYDKFVALADKDLKK